MSDSAFQPNTAESQPPVLAVELGDKVNIDFWRNTILLIINFVLGIGIFGLQIWAYCSLQNGGVFERDATGFSAGFFLVTFSLLLHLHVIKHVVTVRASALYAMMLGVILTWYHCHFINTYRNLSVSCLEEKIHLQMNLTFMDVQHSSPVASPLTTDMCQFVTDHQIVIDILLAFSGGFAFVVNAAILGLSSSLIEN